MRIYGIDEIVQGTPEWFAVRDLKFTASNATAVMACGAGLETLVRSLTQNHFSSQEYEEFTGKYKSDAMQRGNDNENSAIDYYELRTGNTVKKVGFVELNEYVGASPDGLIDDDLRDGDGLIEVKCPSDKVMQELILTGQIDSGYINQMQFQLYVTGRKFVDFVAYNPNFYEKDENGTSQILLYTERVYPSATSFEKIENGLARGISRLREVIELLSKRLVSPRNIVSGVSDAIQHPDKKNVKEVVTPFD